MGRTRETSETSNGDLQACILPATTRSTSVPMEFARYVGANSFAFSCTCREFSKHIDICRRLLCTNHVQLKAFRISQQLAFSCYGIYFGCSCTCREFPKVISLLDMLRLLLCTNHMQLK